MIVSHGRRFIFIKTKKTAGSSVEMALSRYCGSGDVVPPLGGDEDSVREREFGVVPANYYYRPPCSVANLPWRIGEGIFADPAGLGRFLRRPLREPFPFKRKKFPRHMWASDLKGVLPAAIWDDYYKITIERNPWDKAVSRYFWDLHFGGRVGKRSMEEHLEYLAEKDPIQLSNWNIYAEGDRILVDRVILYETLAEELRAVGERLGIEGLRLPDFRAKGNARKDRRPAAEVLSDNAKRIVGQVCSREIERFGYVC